MEVGKYGVRQEEEKPDNPGTDKQKAVKKVAGVPADRPFARPWHFRGGVVLS